MGTTLWVFSNPAAPHLSVLKQLPESVNVLIGNDASVFSQGETPPDCILNCTGSGAMLTALWPIASQTRWIHSLYAGVENMLTPELRASPVPVTNSRGVFKRTLGEFVIAGCLFFAKDLRAMLRNQEQGRWIQYDMEELHGKTMVIVGYGEIGRATAQRAKPFGMRIVGLRRRPELSQDDPLVDEIHPFSALDAILPTADYVVCAAPQTPETIGIFTSERFSLMKPSSVFVNVGRGTIAHESALIQALQEKRIKGAALDVFEKEPLPEGHAFYKLENVLLSPHCADHTTTWLHEAVEFFLANFQRFEQGRTLENIVNKEAGY